MRLTWIADEDDATRRSTQTDGWGEPLYVIRYQTIATEWQVRKPGDLGGNLVGIATTLSHAKTIAQDDWDNGHRCAG